MANQKAKRPARVSRKALLAQVRNKLRVVYVIIDPKTGRFRDFALTSRDARAVSRFQRFERGGETKTVRVRITPTAVLDS